ncbi:cysteine dioxygenase type 1 [Neocloeon triangulifer]|uniref:cysteine dioxygenase type 1 n=1 Tax=Neocloeon triangulifer TaxID=2078957 RepID=UPI00286F4866|nr:cysteine dioxygenase type 1 [Neocloeon triangulifer]
METQTQQQQVLGRTLDKNSVTFEQLQEGLRELFSQDSVNVEQVRELMLAYRSDPREWKKYAKFDRFKYTRNLVDEGNGKYNLIVLCWGEGHGSAIHDHADAHCFMKMLQGTLCEVRFDWPTNQVQGAVIKDEDIVEMREVGRTDLCVNQVCYINDSLGLHRVENPSHTERAVSLHLYCPPFKACSVFNARTGQSSKCPVTFWSKYGAKSNQLEISHKLEDN